MATNFAAATDYLNYTSVFPALSSGGPSKATFALLIRATAYAYSQAGMIAQQWDSNSRNGWALMMDPGASDALRMIAYSGTSTLRVDFNTGVTFDDGNWHSVVVQVDVASGGTNRIYVDGSLAGSGNSSANWTTQTNLRLGDPYASFWTDGFRGDMAEIGYWSGVHLDVSEIDMLNKRVAPIHVRPSDLTFYAPLVRNQAGRTTIGLIGVSGTTASPHPRVLGGMV
ncbi:LamG-like jellyroll fold domain-containing protein [Croceicoccus gelatinilyticus]|uniref:LamG-like jellyroll fold domain-containing protein n=1 Tax=Croceicoccus gelatinilyticus TaxID=2835536 RepID=UPI001BCC43A3|nr:LamG-like jellyroll fold domain-containing protein [Croceicoccus gelatinilyticus]MBS7668803.1 hypothetical protein [Croceicoccus gelatinilyticus]